MGTFLNLRRPLPAPDLSPEPFQDSSPYARFHTLPLEMPGCNRDTHSALLSYLGKEIDYPRRDPSTPLPSSSLPGRRTFCKRTPRTHKHNTALAFAPTYIPYIFARRRNPTHFDLKWPSHANRLKTPKNERHTSPTAKSTPKNTN